MLGKLANNVTIRSPFQPLRAHNRFQQEGVFGEPGYVSHVFFRVLISQAKHEWIVTLQRVAMARAIVAEPEILLADEPTGNLDGEDRRILAQFLQDENRQGRTIVVVTHDDDLIRLGNRTIELVAGRLNGPPSAADRAAQR